MKIDKNTRSGELLTLGENITNSEQKICKTTKAQLHFLTCKTK